MYACKYTKNSGYSGPESGMYPQLVEITPRMNRPVAHTARKAPQIA
jgi:hypothetical protein